MNAQKLCSREKDLGVGLAVKNVAPADHLAEVFTESCGREKGFKILLRSGGPHGTGYPALLERAEQFPGSGQDNDTLLGHKFPVDGLLPVGQFLDSVGRGGPTEFGDDDFVLLPESLLEMIRGEQEPAFGRNEFPGTFMLGGGVDHDTIPVKEDTPCRIHLCINGFFGKSINVILSFGMRLMGIAQWRLSGKDSGIAMVRRGFFITLGILTLLTESPITAKTPSVTAPPPSDSATTDLSASVVRIEVTMQEADYRSPWNAGKIGGGVGSGFVISGRRILTNAHVVSNARFITITREGLAHPYTARVEFIAHDCDLALLSVDDPTFFEGTRPLELGDVPPIESVVSVYGYPLGGERLSVTRGVVSRIDFDLYTHSGVDSHLVIQIDAAINPGNSGGPVLQEGKVVGVAFQGYSGDVAQNIGFMIPTPVIARFLKDLSKGSYTGYTDLAIVYRPLISPSARKALGLPQDDRGILVTDVHENGSSSGFLKKDDIILAIDGHPVTSNGRVELDGQSLEVAETVERKFVGDMVGIDVLRDGKPLHLEFALRDVWPFRMQSNTYDEKPRYLLYGGLLFQPMDRNFMASTGAADLRLRRTFDDYVERHLYLKHPEVVVLSRVLADPVNKDCDGLHPGIVETINGKKIQNLADVRAAFATPAKHDVIILSGNGVPIVLKREDVLKADPSIMEKYGIPAAENLGAASLR